MIDNSGRLITAISEERFSRVKQDGRFPRRALSAVDLSKVHAIGVPYLEFAPEAVRTDEIFRDVLLPANREITPFPAVWKKRLLELGPPVVFYDHHSMHAMAAVACYGSDECLVFTADNGAPNCAYTGSLFSYSQGNLERLAGVASDSEPFASLYTDATAVLGLKPCRHEGKLTGLAARGTRSAARNSDLLRVHQEIRRDGSLYEWRNFLDEHVPPSLEVNSRLVQQYRDALPYSDAEIARSAQDLLEEQIERVLTRVAECYGTDLPLLLSGGLFANVKLNLVIARLGFSAIFVCPPMGDEGLSVGAANAAFAKSSVSNSPRIRTPGSMALGPRCQQVPELLRDLGTEFRVCSDKEIVDITSHALAAGSILARVHGAQEFGPRALGHRSILVSAEDAEVTARLNTMLSRSDYMPFAPILRDARFAEVFHTAEVASDISQCAKYMTICLPVQPWVADVCPAAIHVDGTARPQVLSRRDDPQLFAILQNYERLTGLPLVLNTSFNMHEEPLVSSVQDAVRAFSLSGIDVLLIENCLVTRADNPGLTCT